MTALDRHFMIRAIEAARNSKGNPTDPRVGALAVIGEQQLATSYRGQIEPGQHAEFVLLAKQLENESLAGSTIYTTLEPCTVRNPPKIPCVERLIHRRVSRVVIGMLDPNPLVRGLGYWKLRQAGITVAVIEDDDLVRQLEELNRDFIQAIQTNEVHRAAQEIATLATRASKPAQQRAAATVLRGCLESLRHIHRGEIRVPGREGGYFRRFLERLNETQEKEYVKAFVRLAAFEAEELIPKTWFENFYEQLAKAVREEKLTIEYVFLLRTPRPTTSCEEFMSGYKGFAQKVSYLWQDDPRLTPENLHPSIILFQTQQIAFTHDRGDDGALIEATEWVSKEHYARLQAQFNHIELMSTVFFSKER